MAQTGSADWATNFLMGGVAASISKTVAAPIVRDRLLSPAVLG
jgi:hypothetical protein